MRVLNKSFLFLATIFLIRLLQSCDCIWPVLYGDFHEMTIDNLYHSGNLPESGSTDTMYAEAVAFRVTVRDTNDLFNESAQRASLGFTTAQAFQCACSVEYLSNQQITKFRIITLHPLNQNIPALTDITRYFVGRQFPYHNGNLYQSLENLSQRISKNRYCDSRPIEKIDLYLKLKVQHAIAQFRIDIELSDNRTLSSLTNLINIK